MRASSAARIVRPVYSTSSTSRIRRSSIEKGISVRGITGCAPIAWRMRSSRETAIALEDFMGDAHQRPIHAVGVHYHRHGAAPTEGNLVEVAFVDNCFVSVG